MITSRADPLPAPSEETLRRWLSAEGATIAVKVVEAKVKEAEVNALDAFVLATQKENMQDESAKEWFRKAARYQTFLNVLAEMQKQKSSFSTVKLS